MIKIAFIHFTNMASRETFINNRYKFTFTFQERKQNENDQEDNKNYFEVTLCKKKISYLNQIDKGSISRDLF